MSLHPKTISALQDNGDKFKSELNASIEKVVDIVQNYSALSDTGYLLDKLDIQLHGIQLPNGQNGWIPIRNLVRLLAQVANLDYPATIEQIKIDSMRSGCDYFEGDIHVIMPDQQVSGAYKWQWTAFPGRERSFDKFTKFPEINQNLVTM